ILLPLWKDGSLFDSSLKNANKDEPQPSGDAGKKNDDGVTKESGISDQQMHENSTHDVNIAGPSINIVSTNVNNGSLTINTASPSVTTALLEATHDDFFADETEVDMSNISTTYLTGRMAETINEQDLLVPFMKGKLMKTFFPISRRIQEGFEDSEFPDRVYKVEKALYGLHQAPRAWYETLSTYLLDNGFHRGLQVTQKDDGIFISQDKYVDEILKKFGFLTIKTDSTPMETLKLLLKDAEAEDVDVYLYRSMIGSLMYLTSSRPDIMFDVCACAIFQVTPKVSHLYSMKRIFKYLKGQPKLGLWYPKDSPFDLEAYTDSDYAGASLDRISTTGGFQFLRSKLFSWQFKKQTVVTNSTTEVEYVIAASCCEQVKTVDGEKLIQALVDKKKVIITEISVRSDLHLEDAEGTECLPTATIFKKLTLMGTKTTAWNEFSSTMASTIICLAANYRFNFSKYIFDHMERIIDNLDANEGVTLVDETHEKNDQHMFDIGVLGDEEVVAEKEITTADPVTAVGEVVTTVDHELAERLQAEEQGEATIKERSKLFVELMNEKKKQFARLRIEDKRRKPPTKTHKRKIISTYLKT
nr:uncharacterized mitochondrial protein AtMg00810-like [Tanacetum cinerariifolium]